MCMNQGEVSYSASDGKPLQFQGLLPSHASPLGGAGGGESGVVASVLATTGELARVAGPGLRVHTGEILPLIIEAIQDTSGGHKRLVAVSTLGQVLSRAFCSTTR